MKFRKVNIKIIILILPFLVNKYCQSQIITNYDKLGRISKINYPDSAEIGYSYDLSGNRIKLTKKIGNCSKLSIPKLSVMGDTVLCAFDSIAISASKSSKYRWNNGDTNQTIIVTKPGDYFVIVKNPPSCVSSSRVIRVSKSTTSIPSILRDNDTLIASSAMSYQWYLDGAEILNETNRKIKITKTGNYMVVTKDLYGCLKSSKEYYEVFSEIVNIVNSSEMKLFPNPSSGVFTLVSKNEKLKQITISDDIGRIILQNEYSTQKIEFDLSKVKGGIYTMRIQCENNLQVFNVCIVK